MAGSSMNSPSAKQSSSRTTPSVSTLWTRRVYAQRRRFAIVTAALLSFAVGYHVVFGQNGITAYEQKRHEEKVLTQQVKQLAHDNDALSGHVERLKDDPNAIEHQAREELHYTRPDEVIVTLPPEPQAGK